MVPSSLLQSLATRLTGEFTNQVQAQAQPTWYVPTKLWQCPTPLFRGENSVSLFLEQAPLLTLDQPYRQRLLQLYIDPEARQLYGQYYQFKSPEAWQGGGENPEELAQLKNSDVTLLPTCKLSIQSLMVDDWPRFEARLPENHYCSFEYAGQRRYASIGFDLVQTSQTIELLSYDKGVDPQTNQGLWGALMGPYCFQKLKTDIKGD